MIFSYGIVIFGLFGLLPAAPSEKCTQTEEDFDKCVSKTSIFDRPDGLIPASAETLDAYCQSALESMKCVRIYARTCMPEYARTVLGIFQYDFKRDLKKRCQSEEGRAATIKHMQCAKEKGLAPQKRCVRNYDAMLEWTYNNLPKQDHLAASCCALHWIHRCIVSETTKMCSDPETTKFFDVSFGNMMAETVDYTCGKLKSYADCEANLKPDLWKKILEIGQDPEKIGLKPKFMSPITTVVKLYSQLNL